MSKVVAINGSPNQEHGNTAMLLTPFIDGMREAGAEVELVYASRLDVKPCSCGAMQCWFATPGACCVHDDDMQALYPELRSAEVLVIATPVYVPFPGELTNILNRIVPLMVPELSFRDGRTRARMRDDVRLRTMAVVVTGGWWEKENADHVTRIVEDMAETCSVSFGGALVRPHAQVMRSNGRVTADGEEVLRAARTAGRELIETGRMHAATLDAVSRPLLPEEALRQAFASMLPA